MEKKESAAKAAYARYQKDLGDQKARCKKEPNRWKRFWKYAWLVIKFPWEWLWMACHDWRLILIYIAWMAIVGCEVWVPLLLGLCSPEGAFRTSMLSVASACEAFWFLPLTPFMPICIALTIGTKALIDRKTRSKDAPKIVLSVIRRNKNNTTDIISIDARIEPQKAFEAYLNGLDDHSIQIYRKKGRYDMPLSCEKDSGNAFGYSSHYGCEYYYEVKQEKSNSGGK